jgi:futalosine hydrolase
MWAVRVLVIVAMPEEAEALAPRTYERRRLGPLESRLGEIGGHEASVLESGVGPAASGIATATALALGGPFDLAVSAGIAGGIPDRGVDVNDLVVATEVVAGDLGFRHEAGYVEPAALGWLPEKLSTFDAFTQAAVAAGARPGPVVTVSTANGTRSEVSELSSRYPTALAQAMEGLGVALAAHRWATPFAELRTMSDMAGELIETLDMAGSLDQLSRRLPAVLAGMAAD